MAYATTSDVQARFTGFTLTSGTKPTLAQVTQWLVEADAMLNGALSEAGLTSPNTNANGLEILKSLACDYGEGHLRVALATAGGDGSNDDGQRMLDHFYAWVKGISAGQYNGMLQGGGATGAGHFRAPAVDDDNDDTAESRAPTFTVAGGGDQF